MPIKFIDGRPSIDPAAFRHQVTFLQPTPGSDDSGSTVTWTPGDPPDIAWAEIAPVRGSELIKAGQDVSQVFISATVRYNPLRTRTSQMRLQLVSTGAIYLIQAVENVLMQNIYLVLTCLALGENA